ncbi:hypothetical protein HYT05_04220 [Candidatus Kaiserbacteria bacterium]|nr:hypothetical protein [Candidatus Kaiserbacteria bacterium]
MNWRKWWPFNIGQKRRAERDKYLDEVVKINKRYTEAFMAIKDRSLGELTIGEIVELLDLWTLFSHFNERDPEIHLYKARVLEILLKKHPAQETSPDT